jgi:site-specific DNA-methyltransferase (adenine-specific)
MSFIVHHGDCREVMATLDAESVDAVVCDPPYGLSFMGKGWDHGVPGEEFWTEALRVAKPGAHLLAFGGTRTYHRLACAIEDAGWEIRDCVMWVYGSGFPKSHDVSKAIDKAAGAERGRSTVLSKSVSTCYAQDEWTRLNAGTVLDPEAITQEAAQWSGWGTALKPAWEPIIVARKPLCGTVADNVLTHGTGGINVGGCRVGTESTVVSRKTVGAMMGSNGIYGGSNGLRDTGSNAGRWPANLIHDGSEGPSSLLGSAARFFYCAKASKADRDEGCEGLIVKDVHRYGAGLGEGIDPNAPARNRNHHPTVKPTALMRYLCRLVTPPGGVVLDPFTGSGSTGKAAVCEGFDFVGIEREAEYVEIARARIAAAVLPLEATA